MIDTAGSPSAPALPALRTGRRPFILGKLFNFVLRDFLRSPWPFINLILLVGVHALFFKYESTQSHFFGIQYAIIALLAAINTGAIFSRAHRAETYAILARPVRRATLAAAMLLVAWLVAALVHLLSTLADVIRFSPLLNPGADIPAWRNPLTYLIGSLPILVMALAVVGFVALMSSYVSTSEQRLGIFAVVALFVMSFDPNNFPIEALRPAVERVPPLLAPAAGAIRYATVGPDDPIASFSLAVLVGYALLLILMVLWFSSQREVILD